MNKYRSLPNDVLHDILAEPGGDSERKIAAQKILDERGQEMEELPRNVGGLNTNVAKAAPAVALIAAFIAIFFVLSQRRG